MLQRLIHSARANVFESARFYYWMLVVLTSYFLLNRFLQKLTYVYLDDRWTELKIGEGVLFGLAYVVILISAWFLRKKIPHYVFWCWGGLVLIFLINEFRFAWGNPNYSLMESLTKSQGYYTAKFTIPLLFWGVWSVLKNANHYGRVFVNQLVVFLTINAVFIISGAVFGVSLFESYPLSGRWGYSGLLFHNSINSILYGLLLLFSAENKKGNKEVFVFSVSLLLLGQKAGILYIILILYFVYVKNKAIQRGLFGSAVTLLLTASYWVPLMVKISHFWESVYNAHGVWGVLFSLRNEKVQLVLEKSYEEYNMFTLFFGGHIRFPLRIEMLPFDLIAMFGFSGLLIYLFYILKFVSRIQWAIPLFVSLVAGGLYDTPFGMIVYGIVFMLFVKQKQ